MAAARLTGIITWDQLHVGIREELEELGLDPQAIEKNLTLGIKLHEEIDGAPEEFREYAKGKIAHFKIPRYVWIVDEFPMTVTGKIQKFRIREIAEGWLKEGKRS